MWLGVTWDSRLWSSGSFGASNGAKIATNRKITTMTAPMIATGSRRSRRIALLVSETPPAPSGTWPARTASSSIRSRRRSPSVVMALAPVHLASSSDPHSRVENAVGDVHGQVHQHVHDGEHQDEPLQ